LEANEGHGGITIWGSAPVIRNCLIRGNEQAGIQVGMAVPADVRGGSGFARAGRSAFEGDAARTGGRAFEGDVALAAQQSREELLAAIQTLSSRYPLARFDADGHMIVCPHGREVARVDTVVVENCVITENTNGLVRSDMFVRLTDCEITDHESSYGVWNIADPAVLINARCNWWGDPTGPSGVAFGYGDAVSVGVDYYPWRTGGMPIASSSRMVPTESNNARKIVRDDCMPFYKVAYTHEMGVYVRLGDEPWENDWCEGIEVWPVDIEHKSTDPGIAISPTSPDGCCPPARVHLVWAEHMGAVGAPGEIYYAISDDGGYTWSAPENLSQTLLPSEHPSIAVDGAGLVHIVWEEWETFAPDIFYTSGRYGLWGVPLNISLTPMASVYPTVESNYAYTIGPSLPGASGGAGFGFSQMPGDLGGPARTPDQRVHIAWTEYTPHPIGPSVPWIAYRSNDPVNGWLPPIGASPEDATVGMGGAFASLVAYPSMLVVQSTPAVAWQWPDASEEPPVNPSEIFFNSRASGAWGVPQQISGPMPVEQASRYPSLAVQPGDVADTLWAVWENWDIGEGRSEIYSAFTPDLGQTGQFYMNLSQTRWDLSLRPSLAYQKATMYSRLYDLCWTEIMMDDARPEVSQVWYIGATRPGDELASGVGEPGGPVGPHSNASVSGRLLVSVGPVPAMGHVSFVVRASASDEVSLSIFDLAGRRVRELRVSGASVSGAHATNATEGTSTIAWDGRDELGSPVAPGVYFVEVEQGARMEKGKVVVVR
jgi:hypothetical protein